MFRRARAGVGVEDIVEKGSRGDVVMKGGRCNETGKSPARGVSEARVVARSMR